MAKRKKFLAILGAVLILALLFSVYLLIFRRGERTQAALTEIRMADLPAKSAKEAGHSTTVTAYEGVSVMTDYNGKVHFSSTDPAASLPSDYTFKDGSKEKIMTISGWDETLQAHNYAAVASKLAANNVANAYVGVFETTATGTQNGNLFIENDYSFDGGTTSDNYYDLANFITAANAESIDVYAWITIFGPESTVNVGGATYKTWVDPASVEHQTYINNLISHLLTNYSGLKGIVIDYIRYADAGSTEKYRVYKDGGTYTDYTGNFAPGNATTVISNAVASYKTTIAGFPGKELAAEVFSASDDSTYNNWVKADLGQDYALLAANLDVILPMAYHIGYHGAFWVAEVVDYVYAKTNPGSPSCGVIPHVQTWEDGKDIEWPGPGEIAAATDPIDYAKISGLAFYVYDATSDNEWAEVRDSFDDQGVKTFPNEIIFGSTGTYNLKVEDQIAAISDTQSGITVFDGHANGSLVKASDSPAVYYIQDGMKSYVSSSSVLSSRFRWNELVVINPSEMANYVAHSTEPTLKYREGTLFRLYNGAEVYVVENGQKRWIDSPATFNNKGYNWGNIILAESQYILDAHPNGPTLTGASAMPNGSLVRNTAAVYYLESGQRRYIATATILQSQFRWQDIVVVSSETLNSFPVGSPYIYRQGSVIRNPSNGAIYFVEGAKKRYFISPMFFLGLGYGWEDDVNVESASMLSNYDDGNYMYQLPKYIDVVGDTQRNPAMHQTIANLMNNDRPYLVLHTGDVTDNCVSAEYAIWDSVFGYLKTNTRFYASPGNHDLSCSYFNSRFGTTYYWSTDIDNIHFIILSTNESLSSGSTQYNWLANDLTNQPADTRFTLVYFHKPPYSAGGLADAVTLFEANGVDAIFNGHIHCYERAITSGITYMINGRGGAWPLVNPCHNTGDTEHYESSFGYVRLLLNNNQLELRAYNDSGTLIDSADLVGI